MSRDTFELDWDQDGLHFSFNLDDVRGRGHSIELDGQVRCVLGSAEAIELLEKCEAVIGPHRDDYRRNKTEYDRASPAERAEVLGQVPDDTETGYAPEDPKSPGYYDRVVGDV